MARRRNRKQVPKEPVQNKTEEVVKEDDLTTTYYNMVKRNPVACLMLSLDDSGYIYIDSSIKNTGFIHEILNRGVNLLSSVQNNKRHEEVPEEKS